MSQLLTEAGHSDVRCYGGFVEQWSADSVRPMSRLKRYDRLVDPHWVQRLIQGQQPVGRETRRFVVCHSHYDFYEDYEKGHIPGAIALNTLALESPDTWNRRSPDELGESLTAHGIDQETTVIVYGRYSFPNNDDPYPGRAAGHLGAMRCAAILLYAGVKDVRVLNGGMTRWEDAGLPVSTERAEPKPVRDFGAPIPGHPEYFVDLPEAKRLLASDDGDLVSVRSWDEFIGRVSGYHYIEKKGRIDGAIFGNCGSDAYHMENYRNLDYTTRDYHEIAAAWAEVGITPEKHIAFYCGTGWRGSEAFFNAYLMGWPRVSVYDGGWMEWSSDPDNPVATGVPEETDN
jgi:thiosulfate/3-mercaptopyruvate sulfurtransferase